MSIVEGPVDSSDGDEGEFEWKELHKGRKLIRLGYAFKIHDSENNAVVCVSTHSDLSPRHQTMEIAFNTLDEKVIAIALKHALEPTSYATGGLAGAGII